MMNQHGDSDDESYIECDNDDEKSECDDKYEDDFLTIPQIDDTKMRIVMKYQFADLNTVSYQ